VYLDGSIGARTAALHTPYEDDPTTGTLLVEPGSLRETLRSSSERGISCAVHAIGDRAVATALGEMQAVGDGRFRIEHAEVIGPAEMELARGSSVALVMQPNFVRNWAGENGLYHRRLGGERWRRNNPFRSLVEAGVRIAFSSDGMPPGPLYGIRGATRHPNAAESISATVALELYTDAPTRVGAHPGRPAGRLEPEALCDMVHLSANPLLGDLDGIQILGTWVGGRHVYPDGG
jgi:predicted amidohydrolase YtcJ